MSFDPSQYANFVAAHSVAQERLFLQYVGPRDDFDIIIIGSGIGGGILADALAEKHGKGKRILVLEAGSFIYPTHVYNFCRFDNSKVAKHFACDTFWQAGNSGTENYIGEAPQLNFGGRSIFWSGLIPQIQGWELDFFPDNVKADLRTSYLKEAGEKMNESHSMGETARKIVEKLNQTDLANDFLIQETPRALHQPYLEADGTPKKEFAREPTGVFNTAELLVNQVGLTPGLNHGDFGGIQIQLNQFVEDVQNHHHHLVVVCRNTLTNQIRQYTAGAVVLAAGSIESPKLLRRSSIYPWLPDNVKEHVGIGLTDHPTSQEVHGFATEIAGVPIPKKAHAKIVFYTKGLKDNGGIKYPFNVEMNINHEYWHLRENDPTENDPDTFTTNDPVGASRIDIKFSFANCLDQGNEVKPAPPFGYKPEIAFKNMSWTSYLIPRFERMAGWQNTTDQTVFNLLNTVAGRVFSKFKNGNSPSAVNGIYGQNGLGFGWGTVHHAAGTLRMPFREKLDGPWKNSVVDENLKVIGTDRLYVCDMSVMPFSSAANPVRTLAALALRLAEKQL